MTETITVHCDVEVLFRLQAGRRPLIYPDTLVRISYETGIDVIHVGTVWRSATWMESKRSSWTTAPSWQSQTSTPTRSSSTRRRASSTPRRTLQPPRLYGGRPGLAGGHPMTKEDALDALNVALADYDPPCTGLEVFTADKLTLAEELACARVCARCSVPTLCDAYATAARVDFGYWAGRSRARRRKR